MTAAVAVATSEESKPREEAARILARLRSLPPFNPTAARLLALPFDVDVPLADIEASFRLDPALASQLLSAANSAAFGFRTHISTIRHALAVLGLDRVKSLVTTIATSACLRSLCNREAVRPIWSHAIATAVIAEHLADYADGVSGSLVYTAGLTHDLGRLGMLAMDRVSYQSFLYTDFETQGESDEWERKLFGVTHTQAGAFLMASWGFPEHLCQHAHNHHAPSENDTEEDRIVQSACALATMMGYPETQPVSGAPMSAVDKWQSKCLSDSCRQDVEARIKEFDH